MIVSIFCVSQRSRNDNFNLIKSLWILFDHIFPIHLMRSSPSYHDISVMPDSDEHENDIYEDEEIELSDDDPPAPMVGSFISVYIFRYFSFVFSILYNHPRI